MVSTGARRGQWVPKGKEISEGNANAATKCSRRWGDHRSEPRTDETQKRHDKGIRAPPGLEYANVSKSYDNESWHSTDGCWYEGDASGSASGDDASSPPCPDTSGASTSADSLEDAEELTEISTTSSNLAKRSRNKIPSSNVWINTLQGKESESDGEDATSTELTDGVEAGRKLLTMLMENAPEKDAAPRSEPQPLSTDEFQLWAMQAREDAEIGADVMNAETFGDDSGQGWSFEENLAANEQINEAMSAVYQEELAQAQARAAAELASFYNYGSSYTYEDTHNMQVQRRAGLQHEIERLNMAINKAANFMDLQPSRLNECVRTIINKGWEYIEWRNQYTALHFAAELGHAAALPLIVALGAGPGDVDSKGRTASSVAKHYKNHECVNVLAQLQSETADAEASASSLVRPRSRKQIEQASTEELEKEMRRLTTVLQGMAQFLKIEPWCLQDVVYYQTAGYFCADAQYGLHKAAHYGREDVLSYLLLLRADPFVLDDHGRTALHVAACTCNWGCENILRLAMAGHSPQDIAKLAERTGEADGVAPYLATSTSGTVTSPCPRQVRPPPR